MENFDNSQNYLNYINSENGKDQHLSVNELKDSAKSNSKTSSHKSKQSNDKQIQLLRMELIKEREQHKELQQE